VTPTAGPPTAPLPFSAESLFSNKGKDEFGAKMGFCNHFQIVLPADQTDLLRRELDSRFLDRAGLGAVPPTPPYMRQELHHHQHQHTHLHQHQHQSILPSAPPASAALFPPPLFKDIPKIGVGDSPFYRTGAMGMPAYPGYAPGLLHPGLGGPTQFVPPSHLPSFAPKVSKRHLLAHSHHAKQNQKTSRLHLNHQRLLLTFFISYSKIDFLYWFNFYWECVS
jgi:hypothetical protein